MARRMDLLNKITKQLAILAYEVELMNRSNRMTLNSDAETIFCGLINRLEGWDLSNLNEVSQNYPGIDLADPQRRIAVQITASASAKKVSHTLEVFFKNKMERNFDRLILVIITDKTAPTNGTTIKPGFRFDPKRDIWNIEWFKRRVESIEDCELLQSVADYLDSQLGDLPGTVKRPDHLLPPPPAISEFFLEGSRDRELETFEKVLERGEPLFIWGLGGMGKTQTAIALARRCEPPRGAYFLRCVEPDPTERNPELMFTTICRAEFSGYQLDPGDEIFPDPLMEKAYREKLDILRREYADTLLIIDNFDCPSRNLESVKAERSYQDIVALSNLGVRLVFTTRYPADPAWEVAALPEERLLELMRKSCSDYSDEELLKLIRAVGGHTLAVDLIAKTLEESWQTVTPEQILNALNEYAEDYAHFPEVTSDKDGGYAQKKIDVHLSALFNVSVLTPAARKVMSLATLIAEEGMDDVLFLESLPEEERRELQNLCRRGWLRREDHVITIHPVVKTVCRNCLDMLDENVQEFMTGLLAAQERRKCSDMTLHRVALCLTRGVSWVQDYAVAFEYMMRAMELWERALPDDSPELARVFSEMGSNFYFMGEQYMGDISWAYLKESHDEVRALAFQYIDRAVKYKRRALDIKMGSLPADDPELEQARENLRRMQEMAEN